MRHSSFVRFKAEGSHLMTKDGASRQQISPFNISFFRQFVLHMIGAVLDFLRSSCIWSCAFIGNLQSWDVSVLTWLREQGDYKESNLGLISLCSQTYSVISFSHGDHCQFPLLTGRFLSLLFFCAKWKTVNIFLSVCVNGKRSFNILKLF